LSLREKKRKERRQRPAPEFSYYERAEPGEGGEEPERGKKEEEARGDIVLSLHFHPLSAGRRRKSCVPSP